MSEDPITPDEAFAAIAQEVTRQRGIVEACLKLQGLPRAAIDRALAEFDRAVAACIDRRCQEHEGSLPVGPLH